MGRFTQPDPLPGLPTWPQTQNRYPYTANNPVLHVDPSGQTFICFVWPVGTILCIIGGVAIIMSSGCTAEVPTTCHPQQPTFTPQVQLPVIYNQLTDVELETTIPDPKQGETSRLACGVASIAMVLEYYVAQGVVLPEEREPDPVSVVAVAKGEWYWDRTRGGITYGNMAQMLDKEYGFDNVSTGQLNLPTLQGAMNSRVPLIVGVSRVGGESPDLQAGEGHTVVIVGLSQDDQWVILANPWGGRLEQCNFELVRNALYIRAEP